MNKGSLEQAQLEQAQLEQAQIAKGLAEAVVAENVENTGQVGPGLDTLVEATQRVRQAEEALDPALKSTRELASANADFNSAMAGVDAYRARTAKTGIAQNGDMSGLLRATKARRSAYEAAKNPKSGK